MYSEEVMKHFKQPHNMKEIKDPDGVGKIGNPVCGDVMWLYIKVKDDRIVDIGIKTFGCVAAIATSSMITDLAKGKTLDEAMKLNNTSISSALNGLPPAKIHCSVLAADALHNAIEDYRAKQAKGQVAAGGKGAAKEEKKAAE